MAQLQVGSDIDGEALDDQAGSVVSISADGNRLAIGAARNDGIGNLAGHVRIFEWDGSDWSQLGSDIDGEHSGDKSGTSVSLSSDGARVAIGAFLNDNVDDNTGHVRVFEWNGSAWNQVGTDIDGEVGNEQSGWAVSLSADGTRVGIGAHTSNEGGALSGVARVFEWDGTSWNQLGNNIPGESFSDYSGTAVSISPDGNRFAIGAIEIGLAPGYTRIFEWNDTSWEKLGSTIYGEADVDFSGSAVSLSANGNRVAIGAPTNDSPGIGFGSGHVRIFEWNGSDWSQVGPDIDGEGTEHRAGGSVSISADGNRVAIGATGSQTQGFGTGRVRIFEWNGSIWTPVGVSIDGEASSDFLGRSVSLTADGTRVAIGIPGQDANGEDAGQVKVFDMIPVSTSAPRMLEELSVFPNPTRGRIDISGFKGYSITLFDNLGRMVLKMEQQTTTLDLSAFPSGIYVLHTVINGHVATKKLIKF